MKNENKDGVEEEIKLEDNEEKENGDEIERTE